MRVTLWSYSAFTAVSRYFVKLLDSLGYHARLKTIGPDSQRGLDKFFGFVSDSRNQAQMAAWWNRGAPSPAELTVGLRCRSFVPNSGDNANTAQFCSRQLEGKIEHALRLQATDPAKAGSAWAAVDRQIVDDAPAISLLVPRASTWCPSGSATTSTTRRGESSSASCGSPDIQAEGRRMAATAFGCATAVRSSQGPSRWSEARRSSRTARQRSRP
jgi:hypothetical protein